MSDQAIAPIIEKLLTPALRAKLTRNEVYAIQFAIREAYDLAGAEVRKVIAEHEGCNAYDCGDCVGAIKAVLRSS